MSRQQSKHDAAATPHIVIIGTGFGGSVSAHRLSEKGYSVAVMEMGRRWRAEDFPESNWNARRFYWRPGLGLYRCFNLRPFRCAMADSPERGAIDVQNRMFNYQNLYAVEGSMLGANLGVNPSLTITALAERAMRFIPAKTEIQQQEAA